MFGRVGASWVLADSADHLVIQLPLLWDGDEEAIHQARVAIRRLREVAALGDRSGGDGLDDVGRRLQRAGKALGRARDADIAHHLVDHLESRVPSLAATIGQLRTSVVVSRLKARRKMIKQ